MVNKTKSSGNLRDTILAQIAQASDLRTLDACRVAALGKKGTLSAELKALGSMTPELRAEHAPALHQAQIDIEAAFATRKAEFETEAIEAQIATETQDITLPLEPTPSLEGRIHPVSQVMDELALIFASLGFEREHGPDIETEYYNFTALNIPRSHPARAMHDTFYFPKNADGEQFLLRTHTSPVQIRVMEATSPPYRFIAPGRTYRCDSDQTHTPMFHQLEGLVIDRDIHIGHLKWTLEAFLATFFELDDVAIRLRPSYFPFTEPSMEVDMRCRRDGARLIIGEGDDWLEIGGAGMVHPKVLAAVGIDSDDWQGFAFGMGIDRLAMLKYGLPDLRAFFEADLRWLRHYGFLPFDVPSLTTGLSHPFIVGG